MFIIFAFGVIASLFAAYQAYKAWGVGWAIGTGFGLLVVCLIPYIGSFLALGVGLYIYNRASSKILDDVEEKMGPVGGSRSNEKTRSSGIERQADPMDQIQRLKELRDDGALSREEFEAKKAELLEEI
jgi:hypothetical protein